MINKLTFQIFNVAWFSPHKCALFQQKSFLTGAVFLVFQKTDSCFIRYIIALFMWLQSTVLNNGLFFLTVSCSVYFCEQFNKP